MYMRKFTLVISVLSMSLFTTSGNAQVFFSNGAVIQINSGVNVHCNGGIELNNSTTAVNDGIFTTTKNSTLPAPGNFTLNNASNLTGTGTFEVEQDWINDATFNASTSTVLLNGNTQQFITSTNGTITTFNNLTLTGSGAGVNRKKSLQAVDANIGLNGILTINDRELETQTQSFFVLNTSTTAVTNVTTPGSEGFVSSTAPGTFSRATDVASMYLFPTGSSNGTLRYRPIEITPTTATANTYTVRMNNYDPNLDGFNRSINDGTMCVLNDLYYHSILRSAGSSASDIKMHYINATDGSWANMGHWRTTTNLWNDMSTMSLGTSGVFNTVTRAAWSFTNPGDPYVLTNLRPATPSITCASICENSFGNNFSLTGTSTNYTWTVPSGGTITSGQGSDNINVDWTTGSGYIYAYANGTAGCNSLPDSCMVTVLPVPVADFTYDSLTSEGGEIDFLDLSTNATSWAWNFGDGGTSSTQNPSYQYSDEGIYMVIMTASNAAGCTDSDTLFVEADGGIIIPNVFSPNNDGENDFFYIPSGNLKEYSLQVFNRWGQLMFSSTDKSEKWNGTYNGSPCVEGTYFFVLIARSNSKDFSTQGSLTLVRKN